MTPKLAGDHNWMDEISQATCLKVDEEGTVFAAATVDNHSMSQGPEPFLMRFDRPFLFAVVDNRSGLVVALGRMSDPSDSL